MNNKDSILEKNIQQLLQAGFPDSHKPDPGLRTGTYRRLQKQMKKQIPSHEFSNIVLGLLCGLFLLLMTWTGLVVSSDSAKTINNFPIFIMGGILLLNLVSIPISGYIIVKRSRHA